MDDYLTEIRSKGRYAVTLTELRGKFNASEKAVLQKVFRLKRKGRLAQVRKEFYVIIPPQYSNRGMVPPTLFIDDMMAFLNRDYYVGLFSAAALHGAGHQQPMEFQVVTEKPPLRNIVNQKLSIRFFSKGNWERDQIVERKTEAGYINVSSPELTAFDLMVHSRRIGGLNRAVPILVDLADSMRPSRLARTAKTQKTPTIQRLGFMLDRIGNTLLSDVLNRRIAGTGLKEVPLSLAHESRAGKVDGKWGVTVNTELDIQCFQDGT